MMHRVDDDEGMFAHWSGEDALVDNVWRDRVNNLAIRIRDIKMYNIKK